VNTAKPAEEAKIAEAKIAEAKTAEKANAPNRRGLFAVLAPFAAFATLSIAWTWPLARHLNDALPGHPGDNFSFVWNLWWMRHVLATPGLPYFHTDYLFYPFGTTIVDHPHTALPALAAATLLRGPPVAAAQNVLLIAYVFANMACMYALAMDIIPSRRAALVAAIVFGLSPYVAVHLLGHFDLVAAWPLPLYALALRRAVDRRSHAAAAAGVVLAAAAYIAYYYVVYLCLLTVVYVFASTDALRVSRPQTSPPRAARLARLGFATAAVAAAAIALAIGVTGGATVAVGAREISARAPQNALTAMWLALAACALLTWRPRIRIRASSAEVRSAAAIASQIAAVFIVLASPLLWEAARLVLRGEYVTQQYGWRSIPLGVDALAPFAGHPLHPLFGSAAARAYGAFGKDYVETIGWIGVVPLVLLAASVWSPADSGRPPGRDVRIWRAVAVVFAVWALGPFLTIGGHDTGLKLPAILLRYVPLVENARMPGRAIVMVFMAIAVLIACHLGSARERIGSAGVQWSLAAAIAFEYWAAPLPLTTLDRPNVYESLAAAGPGAVCEAPMGIGDGLSAGVGSQDRRVLFYATQHEHPLVGGYIGRMPADAYARYERMPVAATLLAVSDGTGPAPPLDRDVARAPCRYLVLHRSRSSSAVISYVETLPATEVASSDGVVLYRLQ